MQANEEILAERLLFFGADMTEVVYAEQTFSELLVHVMNKHEEEKASIGKNIHDGLGGGLTALRMETYLLANELSANENTLPLLKRTELMGKLIIRAMNDMRQIINELRPPILDEFGLLAALENHIAQFNKSTSIECVMNYMLDEDDENRLSSALTTHFFRILQEALINVKKHSKASRVSVEIQGGEKNITMFISDNGHGIPEFLSDKGRSIPKTQLVNSCSRGLQAIEERVRQLGGRLSIGKSSDGGFCLLVQAPVFP